MRRFLICATVFALLPGAMPAAAQNRATPEDGRSGTAQTASNPAITGRSAIGDRLFREHRDLPSPSAHPDAALPHIDDRPASGRKPRHRDSDS